MSCKDISNYLRQPKLSTKTWLQNKVFRKLSGKDLCLVLQDGQKISLETRHSHEVRRHPNVNGPKGLLFPRSFQLYLISFSFLFLTHFAYKPRKPIGFQTRDKQQYLERSLPKPKKIKNKKKYRKLIEFLQ